MNTSFIGRFEAGFSFLALPFQISQQDVAGLSEEEAGFSRPAASDQHLVFTITRAHMACGFFEEPELGENAARQSHLSR
jgi:hypothetical protein